jgi:hypothetical protein
MSPMDGAFYEPLGDGRFAAQPATMSPWAAELQHGGPPSALLASEAQRCCRDAPMRLTRLAVEFLGPIPLTEVVVRTRVIRPGKQIRLIDAVLEAGGREVVIARAWFIAVQAQADPVLAALPRRAPLPPPLPPEQPQRLFPGMKGWAYGEAIEWRFVDGSLAGEGPASVWTRVRIPLVAGEPLDGPARLFIVADSANGLSRELSFERWMFVPPAITVTLERYPSGEWVFMDTVSQISPDGIGLCTASLADESGRFAVAAQPLLVAKRP